MRSRRRRWTSSRRLGTQRRKYRCTVPASSFGVAVGHGPACARCLARTREREAGLTDARFACDHRDAVEAACDAIHVLERRRPARCLLLDECRIFGRLRTAPAAMQRTREHAPDGIVGIFLAAAAERRELHARSRSNRAMTLWIAGVQSSAIDTRHGRSSAAPSNIVRYWADGNRLPIGE